MLPNSFWKHCFLLFGCLSVTLIFYATNVKANEHTKIDYQCDKDAGFGVVSLDIPVKGYQRFMIGVLSEKDALEIRRTDAEEVVRPLPSHIAFASWNLAVEYLLGEHPSKPSHIPKRYSNQEYVDRFYRPLNASILPLKFRLRGETGACLSHQESSSFQVLLGDAVVAEFTLESTADEFKFNWVSVRPEELFDALMLSQPDFFASYLEISDPEELQFHSLNEDSRSAFRQIYSREEIYEMLDKEDMVLRLERAFSVCSLPGGSHIKLTNGSEVTIYLTYTQKGQLYLSSVLTQPPVAGTISLTNSYLESFGENDRREEFAKFIVRLMYSDFHRQRVLDRQPVQNSSQWGLQPGTWIENWVVPSDDWKKLDFQLSYFEVQRFFNEGMAILEKARSC